MASRDPDKLLAAWTQPTFADVTGEVAEALGISKSSLVRGAVAHLLRALLEGELTPGQPKIDTCRNGHVRTPASTYVRRDTGYRECLICRDANYENRDRESDRKYSLNYYYAHRDKILEQRRKRRAADPEKTRAQQREYMRAYREKKKREGK